MDAKVDMPSDKPSDIGFDMIKNIIIAQNKQLIKQIATDYMRNETRLLERYLKPEYYLPIVKNE